MSVETAGWRRLLSLGACDREGTSILQCQTQRLKSISAPAGDHRCGLGPGLGKRWMKQCQVPFSSPGFRCCYLGGGSTLPRASSVASSSSGVSSAVKSRIFFWRADWGIARNWNASATELSGGPSGEELITAVPARFARSMLVVRGTTRTDWNTPVKALLCQITTGRCPVYSRGR